MYAQQGGLSSIFVRTRCRTLHSSGRLPASPSAAHSIRAFDGFRHAHATGSAMIHRCRMLATFTTSASAGKTSIASASPYPHSRLRRCRSSHAMPSCHRSPASVVRHTERRTTAGALAANSCTKKSRERSTRNCEQARAAGHCSRGTSRSVAGCLALSRSSCLRCILVVEIPISILSSINQPPNPAVQRTPCRRR